MTLGTQNYSQHKHQCLRQVSFRLSWLLKSKIGHKSPDIDQIPPKFIKAAGSTIRCEILKLIISIWNKEKFAEEWKKLIRVPMDKKGDNTDFSNYRGISLLQTTFKILSNILLSRLIPYAEEIIGHHQCGF